MLLSIALFVQFAAVNAPQVAPGALAAVVAPENGFDSLAIFDSTPDAIGRPWDPGEAIALAWRLIGAGDAVDLDSGNLARLHLTVSRAFDARASLRGAAAVLASDYRLARAGL
ncbi:MAG TPA: hypothetical protein VMF86_08805 [Stellaceae bacterium]|nr:hypothetical protein [Stellaceae bacterium]